MTENRGRNDGGRVPAGAPLGVRDAGIARRARRVCRWLRRSVVPLSLFLSAGTLSAQRPVTGNVITSDTLPAARIAMDSALRYVGTQTITLGGGSRAEQHFWVDAVNGRVRRFYWLQFEGKPPGARPFDYGRDSLVVRGEVPWRVAFRYYPPSGLSDPPGSDGEAARQRVEAEGFTFGPDLARVRLVWLLGEPAMDELMVIYVEDLAQHGLSVAALEADPARWHRFRAEFLTRALGGMRVD